VADRQRELERAIGGGLAPTRTGRVQPPGCLNRAI
jgi:hypothetical protein